MEAPHSFQANLHRAGDVYYEQLTAHEKGAVVDAFRAMDTDGNGIILQAEVAHAIQRSPNLAVAMAQAPSLGTMFRLLDKDGNGSLDFTECKALLFLTESITIFCKCCKEAILDNLTSFGCRDCFHLGDPSFDLCLKCFPQRASIHPHHHRFLPLNYIYNQLAISSHLRQQAQCVICGDFHIKDITSFFFGGSRSHMICEDDKYVCEWCFTWSCTKCGKWFKGDVYVASPRRWLLNTYYCTPCGEMGNHMTDNDSMIQRIKSSEVVQGCTTCKIKAKNGTLWESRPPPKKSSVEIVELEESTTSHRTLSNVAKLGKLSISVGLLASNIIDAISSDDCAIQ